MNSVRVSITAGKGFKDKFGSEVFYLERGDVFSLLTGKSREYWMTYLVRYPQSSSYLKERIQWMIDNWSGLSYQVD